MCAWGETWSKHEALLEVFGVCASHIGEIGDQVKQHIWARKGKKEIENKGRMMGWSERPIYIYSGP